VITLPLALLGRSQAADFAPCSAAVTAVDDAAGSWWVVPVEIRTWMRQKSERCHNGELPPPLSDLPVVSWGVYDDRTEDGIEYRWTSDHAVLALSRAARSIALAFRRPDASSTNAVSVRIRGGTTTTNLLLESPEWQYATVSFSPGVLAALRDGHRLDIDVSPWFVPAVLDPRNSDLRRFGVHLRVIAVNSR
jgi:hypothetical protein